MMKTITVTVDDETDRAARVKAAAMGTSVAALVKRYLAALAAGGTEFERLKREERELRKLVPAGFSAADRLSRDEVHER
jgi:hypothetical protein